jgi:probable rRNA maturation factor
MITVVLINDADSQNIPASNQFQQWVDAVTTTMSNEIPTNCHEICISIIDQETSADLNETYRQKSGPTNVLSFSYEPTPGVEQDSLGDLAICAEIVESEASTQQKNMTAHWAHLTVHGMLHLLGYDHIAENEAVIMETLETRILQKLGFENPYE